MYNSTCLHLDRSSPGSVSVRDGDVVDVVEGVLEGMPVERGVVGGDVGDVILPVNIVHVVNLIKQLIKNDQIFDKITMKM